MDRSTSGWINGLIGVVIFSSRHANCSPAFDLVFLTVVRAVRAGMVGRPSGFQRATTHAFRISTTRNFCSLRASVKS
jgi:hypothetical protein